MTPFLDYVNAAPAQAQMRLLDILAYVADRFPSAEQRIYHKLPSFFVDGHDVLNVGAYSDHIGLHVGYGMADDLKCKYPDYTYTKSTIQFPYSQPIPIDILEDICTKIASRLG